MLFPVLTLTLPAELHLSCKLLTVYPTVLELTIGP